LRGSGSQKQEPLDQENQHVHEGREHAMSKLDLVHVLPLCIPALKPSKS